MGSLAKVLSAAKSPQELKNRLSNFHILCFIKFTDMLSAEEFKLLCEVATSSKDVSELDHSSGWQTLQMVLKESGM
jgi:nuclear protein localization family protein 4